MPIDDALARLRLPHYPRTNRYDMGWILRNLMGPNPLWLMEAILDHMHIEPGMRVLECSTGNAGIACAFVAAVKGYRCTIVMPEGMSEERKKIMRAYGADLVFTPGGESDGGADQAGADDCE